MAIHYKSLSSADGLVQTLCNYAIIQINAAKYLQIFEIPLRFA